MRRFLLPNNTVITEKALRDFYAKVRRVIADRDKTDILSIQEEVLAAVDLFFSNLGKPQYQYKEIKPDDPLIPVDFNEMIQLIVNDIFLGYEEVENLRDAAVATYNYSSMQVAELQRRADEISSLVTDLSLLSGQQGEEVLVFSDNFNDESKLDASFPLEHQPAQVMPGQGSLTLFRVGLDTATFDDVEIEVFPLGSYSRSPSATNVGRFYEGHFYSYTGDAEPEGGSFHLDEKIDQASLDEFDQSAFEVPELPRGKSKKARKERRKLKNDFVIPGGFEAKFLEQVKSGLFNDKFGSGRKGQQKFNRFIRKKRKALHRKDRPGRRQLLYYAKNPEEAESSGIDLSRTVDVPVTIENLILVDAGASEEELQEGRAKMLDSNAASYWQCEVVRETNVIQNYIDNLTEETGQAEVSATALRELAVSEAVDKEDLEVDIVFTFNEPRVLNWITLNAMIFDDGAFLEVTDVSTSPDLESEFEQVDSFSTRQFANILTEEANEEIPKDLSTYLLAPTRYSYRGLGIWPFAARIVQQVRIRVKQRTPVPNPFERIVLEATRTSISRVRKTQRRN